MAKRSEKDDPREWLKEKLGEADFAAFEEGLRKGSQLVAEGKVEEAEVEGQAPCGGTCISYCLGTGNFWAWKSGYWAGIFRIIP